MRKLLQEFDAGVISHLQKLEVPFARTAIFIVYFWFGTLKLLGLSPAGSLVQSLFERTISFISFNPFYVLFAIFEMSIGLLFLKRGLERLAIFLIGLHLIMIVSPLFLLPHMTWQGFLVPTLEGQYIIKNVLIAAAAIVVGSKLIPIK